MEDKVSAHTISYGVFTKENKLNELKEQFCRWHCPGRDVQIEDEQMIDVWCKECERDISETIRTQYGKVCDTCNVAEYIRFIRDDI